ncbi:Crp/Fnr family transcriptional regulator [Candidatus Woesebacteria bacterium]|nr:Crp/Fnr family transcriptional regulator [Candidatus Woesebacteria bacterium]
MQTRIVSKLEKFFSTYTLLRQKQGYNLVLANENPAGIYFLKKGSVRQYSISADGKELTIHTYFKGSFFPLIWGILGVPNAHYFELQSDSIIYVAPPKDVLTFLNKNPDIQEELIKRLLFGLVGMTTRIETSLLLGAKQRVISVLLYLAKHYGTTRGKKVRLKHKFTHEDLAKITGLTRETVSKVLEKLEGEKRLKFSNHQIVLVNQDKLKEEILI